MVSKISFYTWSDLMPCIAQYLPICKENVHSRTTPYIVYMVICQWCATSLTNNHIYSIRWRNNNVCVYQCFPFRSAIPKEIMPLLKIYVRHIDRYLPKEYVQEFQGDLWYLLMHTKSFWPSDAILATKMLIKIGSGNGLFPDGIKPLPVRKTCHPW